MKLQFGKYKGQEIKYMTYPEQVRYLQWYYHIANKKMKEEILKHFNNK